MTQHVNMRDLMEAQDNQEWRRPYRAVNGHTKVQISPRSTWNAVCTADCAACHGTGEYADEPWHSDGML